MMWLVRNPQVNGIYNVGFGQARSWNDLVKAVYAALQRDPAIRYIDMPESIRNQYQYFTEAPTGKLRAAGYSAPMFSLEDGIRDYITQHLLRPNRHW
jgi:ADP-L-glycero-D-manno-heptose 6-epimerase